MKRIVTNAIPLILIAALIGGSALKAQQPRPKEKPEGAHDHKDCMEHMQKMHNERMAEMKKADDRILELMKKVKGAAGQKKIDAMQELLDEMVRQRLAMTEKMQKMHDEMMKKAKEDGRCPMHPGMHDHKGPGGPGGHDGHGKPGKSDNKPDASGGKGDPHEGH